MNVFRSLAREQLGASYVDQLCLDTVCFISIDCPSQRISYFEQRRFKFVQLQLDQQCGPPPSEAIGMIGCHLLNGFPSAY